LNLKTDPFLPNQLNRNAEHQISFDF